MGQVLATFLALGSRCALGIAVGVAGDHTIRLCVALDSLAATGTSERVTVDRADPDAFASDVDGERTPRPRTVVRAVLVIGAVVGAGLEGNIPAEAGSAVFICAALGPMGKCPIGDAAPSIVPQDASLTGGTAALRENRAARHVGPIGEVSVGPRVYE